MEHEIVRGIKETGVKRIRIHDLRHSHASLLVELGFQPLAIAERLGHEKIETTLNTYSHLYPNKQPELADRLELENSLWAVEKLDVDLYETIFGEVDE